MDAALSLMALILVETVAICVICHYEASGPLSVMTLNMVLITLFAPAMIDLGGYVTNIGCVFYASVVCCQCISIERSGVQSALMSVPRVNCVLAMVFAIGTVLRTFPVVWGNEVFMQAVRTIIVPSMSIVTASFVSFFLSQMVLVRVWKRVRPGHGPVATALLAAFACQSVDSPVFFFVAFWGKTPLRDLSEMIAIGFLFKCALAVVFVPAFLVATRGTEALDGVWLRLRLK